MIYSEGRGNSIYKWKVCEVWKKIAFNDDPKILCCVRSGESLIEIRTNVTGRRFWREDKLDFGLGTCIFETHSRHLSWPAWAHPMNLIGSDRRLRKDKRQKTNMQKAGVRWAGCSDGDTQQPCYFFSLLFSFLTSILFFPISLLLFFSLKSRSLDLQTPNSSHLVHLQQVSYIQWQTRRWSSSSGGLGGVWQEEPVIATLWT
jgi:hypothetical protein